MDPLTSSYSRPSEPSVPRDVPTARKDGGHDDDDGEEVKKDFFLFRLLLRCCELAVFVDGKWFVTGRVAHRG